MQRSRASWVVGVVVLLSTGDGHAQQSTKALTFGVTAVRPVPLWNDVGTGLAPWVGARAALTDVWQVTGRAGWIGYVDRQQTVGTAHVTQIRYGSWQLPVLAGVEYGKGERGLLFAGELGYVMRATRVEWEGKTEKSTDHGVGVSIGGGYHVGGFQARAQLFVPHVADPAKYKALMIGLQWALPL